MSNESRQCPECREVADHPPAVRQGTRQTILGKTGIIDIGWRCQKCGHEWGFEVLTEPVR